MQIVHKVHKTQRKKEISKNEQTVNNNTLTKTNKTNKPINK